MHFRFEPRKATQAAALLAKHAGGRINYTKMLKLLYLADRQSLIDTGSPITGDRIVNMTNGPVLSGVYDCIKGSRDDCASWNRHFHREGKYDIVLMGEPGDSELSDYEIELLTRLADKHRNHGFNFMIHQVCHHLPEWKDPGEGRRQALGYEEILCASGLDQNVIKAYQARNEAVSSVEKFRTIRI